GLTHSSLDLPSFLYEIPERLLQCFGFVLPFHRLSRSSNSGHGCGRSNSCRSVGLPRGRRSPTSQAARFLRANSSPGCASVFSIARPVKASALARSVCPPSVECLQYT